MQARTRIYAIAVLSETPSTAVGQVSADGQFRWDGQQWVPIPRGAREPTSWTRPMQLTVAGFFALNAAYTVISSAIYINHDSMLRVIKAQGNMPSGTDPETVVGVSLFFAFAFIVFFAVLALAAALGSYLGWRWMFWVALVLFGFGSIGAVTNLFSFSRPATTEFPIWALGVSELFGIASAALFVWLLIAAVKFGPWAMKRPGT